MIIHFHRTIFYLVLLVLPLISKSQGTNDYKTEWKKVEDFMSKGLPKSAIEEVNIIYGLAKKYSNDQQLIKALLYRITISQNIQEDANIKNIKNLESEILTAHQPAKSILLSIVAEMYQNMLQRNRYKLYSRTKTKNFIKEDIDTWDIDDYHAKIAQLYMASIREENLLKQTKLEAYDAIIIKGNSRSLRPTLFDLLAHRALSYFKNNERDANKPAYAFEISDEKAFAPVREFARHRFINKDSASLYYKAILIFQQLLLFHEKDITSDALIDADIERISFMFQYGVMKNKDGLYLQALRQIIEKYTTAPAAQANYLAAQFIFDKASAKVTIDTTLYSMQKAKEIVEGVIRKWPDSEGGINALNLLRQITHKTISLTSEKVNLPETPFRTLVSYKNVPSLYFRLIELTPAFKTRLETNPIHDELWSKLTSQPFLRAWKQVLPSVTDFKEHSVEVKVDGLPVGQYALLASFSADFTLNDNPLSVQYFHISAISYINSSNDYFILDRKNGQPLAGASVQVWKQYYDYKSRINILQKKELVVADKNGFCQVPTHYKNDEYNYRLEITFKKDKLFLDDYQYNYNNSTEAETYKDQGDFDKTKAKIFLFTDRIIYRPGQLVYFKGIGVTQDFKTRKNKLLRNKDSIQFFLYDANSQEVDSIKLLLNDYGSCNGKFRLPANQLNGEFKISADGYENSSIDFSVEEYKRPKFFAEFEKVKGSYHVNDKIKITGFAKAFSGNNIDGAKVKYRVTREARFPYAWMFWSRPRPVSSNLEITSGDTITGADGKFTIAFDAIPDLSVDKTTDPIFDYKVEADITDINGETRSTSITVPVGYKALTLQVTVQSTSALPVDSLKYIFISTKNLSGEFEPSLVNLKIYQLQAPARLIKPRYWQQPDQFLMKKQEYLQYFPNDDYNDDLKKESWPKGALMLSMTDSTKINSRINLQSSGFKEGWYVAEVTTKDKYGETVEDIKYFELFNTKAMSLLIPSYAWHTVIKNVVEPGEDAAFITGTSARNVFLIEEIDRSIAQKATAKEVYHYYNLNGERKMFQYPVSEDDRGGFSIHQFFVKDNRFFKNTFNASVPWTNKELSISFDTYRDKTQPGSNEKWKIKLTGHKGEKIASEMLVSMYDASLDQFKKQTWVPLNIWPDYYSSDKWQGTQNFSSVQSNQKWSWESNHPQKNKSYDQLMTWNSGYGNNLYKSMQGRASGIAIQPSLNAPPSNDLADVVVTGLGTIQKQKELGYTVPIISRDNSTIKDNSGLANIQTRKNFNETAFFYPDLRTDKEGNIEFNFTMPEALTQWKLMAFAHTRNLASGYNEKLVITQKDLMVQPNAPRFLREGDSILFTAKIVNLSDKEISGDAELQLLNASSMTRVDSLFNNDKFRQHFITPAGQSSLVKFKINIPYNFNDAVVYRIVAQAGNVSDGEEAAVPVLSNRMLVTETMPLPVRGSETKHFIFNKLLHAGNRQTLTHHALTVEYTTNPAWYAVQALPYLMEYPYECAEQTFNRYYANSIASKIVSSSPKIKAVFDKWKTTDTSALLSNLQKNEELKSVLLQETPWVLEARNESQQKKNIALLFDMVKMSSQMETSVIKLKEMQSGNGGFVWFKGGQDDRYMTQYILSGIGHLKHLKALNPSQETSLKTIISIALPYLDKRIREDYDFLIAHHIKLDQNNLGDMSIHYLYMRSFFTEYPIEGASKIAYNYYRDQAKKYWLSQGKYMQAMIALSLYRSDDKVTPVAIIRSLKENAIVNEELGMYWKEWTTGGYYWYQSPIESQAMMIEAFSEIDRNIKVVDDLKTWLLKNKQTNNWHTTRATAEACYSLLLQGTDWLSEEKNVTITLGKTSINNNEEHGEAGTGYFKKKIDGDNVMPDMGNISVTVSTPSTKSSLISTSWGAVYWQYFENLDKITFAETPLKINKKLFIEKNTDRGPVLDPIRDGAALKVGDKIKVRIELRVDRDMEYVHMKDMRASCMEPVNVISGYKYQGGLGYYESTKDANTNFFFGSLTRGTYVFEYPMFVTHAGNFSNGITTIQCMYAPEFTSHSEGVRVRVTP